MLDDLFTYRLGERGFLTVTNAANHERDLDWMRAHARGLDADVVDRAADFAMLAVQGPARAARRGLSDGPLPGRFHCCQRKVAGAPCSCAAPATPARTASSCCSPRTRERGLGRAARRGRDARWAGRPRHVRLEACFHLYGNDLSEDRDPIGAGLGWCCVGGDRFHR